MKFSSTIFFRVFVFLLVVGAVIFTPITWLMVNHARTSLLSQVMANAATTSTLIIQSTRYNMLQDDDQAVALTLKSISKVPGVQKVRLMGKQGVAYSSDPEEAGAVRTRESSSCVVCHRGDKPLLEIPGEQADRIVTNADGSRSLVRLDPIANSRSCSMNGCHPAPDKLRVLGVLETTLSLVQVDAEIAVCRQEMIVMSIIGIVFIEVLAGAFIWLYLHRRLQVLSHGHQRVSAGDYDARVLLEGSDEIASLAQSFNVMTETIGRHEAHNRELIANIAETSTALASAASQLSAVASQQSSGASEQVATVQEVVVTAQEIAATAGRIAENAEHVNVLAEQAAESSDEGRTVLQDSVQGIDRINQQVALIGERMGALVEKSGKVRTVVDLIEEISVQTNLLSLNAQIEAVRAGETGTRFRTVAEEVRRLAGKTLEATRIIRENVNDMHRSVEDIGQLGAQEREVVEQGIESVRALVQYFETSLDQAARTREAVSTITLVTQQQASAGEEMVEAVREVEQVAHQSEAGARTIESLIVELSAMAGRLQQLVGATDREADGPSPDPL